MHDPSGHTDETMDSEALRARWLPIREDKASAEEYEAIRIRLHRCLSWMRSAEQLPGDTPGLHDLRLIHYWIAYNALYGRWNEERHEPMSDKWCMKEFLWQLRRADRDDRLPKLITAHRPLVKQIVDDAFLNRHYWEDLSRDDEVGRNHSTWHRVRSWYAEDRHVKVLDAVLDRVYLARCQLVHGAATMDGSLNRECVRLTARFMQMYLPQVFLIIADHAWTDDWGRLCYPPVHPS